MDEARDRDAWAKTAAVMWIVASVNRSSESPPVPWGMFDPYAGHMGGGGHTSTLSKEEFARAHRRYTRRARLGKK